MARPVPRLVFGAGVQITFSYLPDRLPIGLESDRRGHVFLYLITRTAPVDFRAFLHRHAELRALPVWTIRLLVTTHLSKAADAHAAACAQELAAPLRPAVVDELRCTSTRIGS